MMIVFCDFLDFSSLSGSTLFRSSPSPPPMFFF